MKHPQIVKLALGLLLLGFPACAIEDDDPTSEAQAQDSTEITRNFDLLAIVDLDDGGRLEFGQMDSGGIVVIEETSEGALSPIDALMTAQEATPLELFMAVAPPDRAIPQALIETHERFAVDHGRSVEPRALEYSPSDPSFRANYDWYYAADCSLSDDGDWFDDFWDTYNWNWHWYYRGNAYTEATPSALNTHAVQTHLCNDGPSGNKNFFVKKSGVPDGCAPGSWYYVYTASDVEPGHRIQFRAWDDPLACAYSSRADWIGWTPYPTYSLGITKP